MNKYDTPKKIADRLTILQNNVDAQVGDDVATPRARLATFVGDHHGEIRRALLFIAQDCPHKCAPGSRCPHERLKAEVGP